MKTPLLAMHMANELLSVPVAAVTLLIAALVVAIAARRARGVTGDDRLPLMGVMGAFVFAAQMINFTLPGMPGTSGHLGGGVLLAILLGPSTGIVIMAAILIVQCLLFQDGGLLALGCNIINMGVVPCLVGWTLYRGLLGRPARASAGRQYLAAWFASIVAVTAGAAMVPVEAAASGVLQVPFNQFLGVMVGVHLLIGFGEGAVTFAIIAYLRRVRPELMGLEPGETHAGATRPGYSAVAASFVVTAMLLAGVVSWFASTWPDGLEWCLGQLAPEGVSKTAASWPNPDGWRSLAGVLGTIVTLGMLYGASCLMRRRATRTNCPDAPPLH
jgi:cobalt/nickel transport system permease protein